MIILRAILVSIAIVLLVEVIYNTSAFLIMKRKNKDLPFNWRACFSQLMYIDWLSGRWCDDEEDNFDDLSMKVEKSSDGVYQIIIRYTNGDNITVDDVNYIHELLTNSVLEELPSDLGS